MPHIELLTTSDLPENADVPDILQELVTILSAQETVAPERVKARHLLISNWVMGEGAPAGFAHCTVSILAGRTDELKRRISQEMYAVMKRRFAVSYEAKEVSLTLELREMDRETYQMG